MHTQLVIQILYGVGDVTAVKELVAKVSIFGVISREIELYWQRDFARKGSSD